MIPVRRYVHYHKRLQSTVWWVGFAVLLFSHQVQLVVGEPAWCALILILFGQYWFRRRVRPATSLARGAFRVLPPQTARRDPQITWIPLSSCTVPRNPLRARHPPS